jgi:hypothetical protein
VYTDGGYENGEEYTKFEQVKKGCRNASCLRAHNRVSIGFGKVDVEWLCYN